MKSIVSEKVWNSPDQYDNESSWSRTEYDNGDIEWTMGLGPWMTKTVDGWYNNKLGKLTGDKGAAYIEELYQKNPNITFDDLNR